jgi:hypothetical protein
MSRQLELGCPLSWYVGRLSAKELIEFLAGFWPVGFDAMEKLIEEKGGSGEAIET